MWTIKPLEDIELNYHHSDMDSPVNKLAESLVAYLYVRALEQVLDRKTFNNYVNNFTINSQDQNYIADILEQEQLNVLSPVSSIEFIFNDYDYVLSVLASTEEDIYTLKIKLTKQIFLKRAAQLSQHLNTIYSSEEPIEIDAEKIIKLIAGDIMTLHFAQSAMKSPKN